MRVRSARRAALSVLLATLMIIVSATAVLAGLTPPGDVTQRSWDPIKKGWTTGTNTSYGEGDTAVMSAEISTAPGVAYDLPICLQAWELPLPTKAYIFSKVVAYNTAGGKTPTVLPGGEAIPTTLSGTDWVNVGAIYGYNIDITSVVPLGLGQGGCDANYFGVDVFYTRPNNTNASYILWGGYLVKPGDAAADGTIVDKGSSNAQGVFQVRLKTSAADKTLNFKPGVPTAVVLGGLSASAGIPVFGLALVGLLVVAGGSAFGWKRLRRS